MADTAEVTGGDLHNLWKTAHMAIPEVENAYIDMTEIHDKTLSHGSEDKYGKVFTVWHIFQQVSQLMLFRTALTLRATRLALDLAVVEYSLVDGDAEKGISEAGEDLAEYIVDPNLTDPDLVHEVDGDPIGPDDGEDK